MICNWNFSSFHNPSNRVEGLFSLVLWFLWGELTALPQGVFENMAVVLILTMIGGCTADRAYKNYVIHDIVLLKI